MPTIIVCLQAKASPSCCGAAIAIGIGIGLVSLSHP